MSRTVRLLLLEEILRDGWYTTAELANRLRVTQRTVQRDIADLEAAPLRRPLTVDGQGRYHIPRRVCD
jgi:predicted DNA-binding transcriptional regulator YafY